MDKELNNKIKTYFGRTEKNSWKCLLCPNDKIITGNVGNCKDHLTFVHADISETLQIQKKGRKRTSENESSERSLPLVKRIKYSMDINQSIREIIKLFLDQNISLKSADNLGKIFMISEALKEFKITLNRSVLKDFIIMASEKAYGVLAEELKDVIISVMFDSASRNGRNVFGVGIRYMKEKEIKERTIGVLTQQERQYGVVLAAQVRELLDKVGKKVDDIYSSCTDGGKNMIKASEVLKEAQKQTHILSMIVDEDEEEIYDELVQNITNSTNDETNEDCEEIFENSEEFEHDRSNNVNDDDGNNLENEEFNCQLQNLGRLCSITHCGAHSTQLWSNKISKKFERQLSEIRSFIKSSNSAEYRHLFKDIVPKFKQDCYTRWCSSYEMVNSVYIHKNKIKSITNPIFELRSELWMFIDEYVLSFCPVFEAMKFFQRENITSGDFYIGFLKLQSKLSCIIEGKFKIKSELLKQIELQTPNFLLSDALVANLVIDPRIHWKPDGVIYNHGLLTRGINNILKILKRKQELTPNSNPNTSTAASSSMPMENFRLNQLLGADQVSQNVDIEEIKEILFDFAYLSPRADEDSFNDSFKIIDFWFKKRHEKKFITIYNLAQIVLAAPFAQTKVERTFSIFALTLTHLRNNLSGNTLNALLFLRDNQDMLDHINFV